MRKHVPKSSPKVLQRARDRIARAIAAGICCWCRKAVEPDRKGKQWCKRCYERGQKSLKAIIAKRRAVGKCLSCGSDDPVVTLGNAFPECKDCLEEHRVKSREFMRKLYAERRAAGLCYRCGDPVAPGMKSCGGCRSC